MICMGTIGIDRALNYIDRIKKKGGIILEYQYKLTFCDTDYARVIFHGRAYDLGQRFHEQMLFERGISYREMMEKYEFDLAVVDSRCRFYSPLTLDDVVKVEIGLTELTDKGVNTVFNIYLD